MMLMYKVEVGSAMYKEGIRWTESLQSIGLTDIRTQSMVLDYILTISMIYDYDHPVTLVMLIIIISGAWSHQLQQEEPAGEQHELVQLE